MSITNQTQSKLTQAGHVWFIFGSIWLEFDRDADFHEGFSVISLVSKRKPVQLTAWCRAFRE
jgi:hypothetical protein